MIVNPFNGTVFLNQTWCSFRANFCNTWIIIWTITHQSLHVDEFGWSYPINFLHMFWCISFKLRNTRFSYFDSRLVGRKLGQVAVTSYDRGCEPGLFTLRSKSTNDVICFIILQFISFNTQVMQHFLNIRHLFEQLFWSFGTSTFIFPIHFCSKSDFSCIKSYQYVGWINVF